MVDAQQFSTNYLSSRKFSELNIGKKALIIETVESHIVSQDDINPKLVMSFETVEEKLVLNNTNINTLISKFGGESDDWIGESIHLFLDITEFNGKEVEGIRIK